jgi:DegV family protein with EDD domain
MPAVRIVTDSTCDLPEAVVASEGIRVIPLYVNVGSKGYLDGVQLSRDEFYQQLPTYPVSPTTAAPGIETMKRAYDELAAEGATGIVSIHISQSLSNTVDVARLAAQDTTSVPVTVIDSGQLTLGVGLAAVAAARAAAKGATVPDVVDVVRDHVSRTYTFAALSTVEFLRRSGRLSRFQSGLASVLRIIPLLKMHVGEPEMEKVRTHRRAVERVRQLAADVAPLETLAIVHTNALDRAEDMHTSVQGLIPPGTEPLYGQVTPVIGAHIGPGAVGLVCISTSRAR